MSITTQTQEQAQKANHAIELLRTSIGDASNAQLFGEVTITVKFQNGQIGHYEKVTRETYK